uniref:Uncharacterized protein n=1 Tax=Podoviridae sp. ctrya9 TaxID=2825280 RepID=A0A8S5P662_9CAUD|nr:MAG TPA: hypothetical protein [Podoviridae sp. ctrya9]
MIYLQLINVYVINYIIILIKINIRGFACIYCNLLHMLIINFI